MSKRGTFEKKKKEATALCWNESYLVSRNRKKKHPADGSQLNHPNLMGILYNYLIAL